MKKSKTKKEDQGFFKKLIDNSTENIKDISKNIVEGVSVVGEKVKETAAKVYVSSSQVVDETSEKIHHYTEVKSLNHQLENKLKEQDELTNSFGKVTLSHFIKKNSLNKSFLTTKTVEKIVVAYTENTKTINKLKRDIKKLEN
jgi:hypothetical protein